MENMRPGVAERLGVGYERLSAINPRLIYSSVTAFGSSGPDSDRPGFDPIFQALGGLMTLQGFGGPPVYLRTAPTDYYTAALATQGILSALFARERTGRGQRVETSLLRGALALQAGGALDYPSKPTLLPDNPTYPPYQAGDGAWFFLAVGNQTFWLKLCKALELERLADDPRFGSWLARLENNQALLPLIESKFRSQPRDHWLELLAKHDIPAAPVQTVMEFMQHPAVRHHDMVREYEHPEVGRLRVMGQPIAFTDTPTRDPGPPPTLGEHTDAVLHEIGYTDEEIAELLARGVCSGPAGWWAVGGVGLRRPRRAYGLRRHRSMAYEAIRYELADGIATITLNRPTVHNAMNERMREELTACFGELARSEDARVIVMT